MQTILIVDDEPAFLDILQAILRRAGYVLLTAANGIQALEMIRVYRPDLALVDDMLPSVSGGEVCQTIKSDPDLCQIPIVLYSAGPRIRDRNFIQQIRADAVLYKPFRPDEVVRVIHSCLPAPA
ncbi:MAG: response regulator [Chloroflexi bacterium]|nr:response regulator [Chloroflexota bacterium]